MRRLDDHKIEGIDAQIDILVNDEPGPGGACHEYDLHLIADPDPTKPKITAEKWTQTLKFQKGPVGEAGVNGVTHEALLTVLIDRLRCFQQGPFACRENAIALTHCEDALMWLQKRTRSRLRRGVEGTSQK